MPKPNYLHVRREKERARKARRQGELQRRTARDSVSLASAPKTDGLWTTVEPDYTAGPFQSPGMQ
jgi:hypothetical protein